ncbi:XkdX family protein [Viridibacillus sp. FSL R5-0468]
MDYYAIVERYYPKYYTKDQVKVFVVAEKITPEEYKEITNENYKG